jgi:RNA polymerase-binding transcription factor DksA
MAKKKNTPAKSPAKKAVKKNAAKSKAIVQNRKSPSPKPASTAAVKQESKPSPASTAAAAKASAREDLRNRVLARSKVTKPISFTLDEAREIAKTVSPKQESEEAAKAAAKASASSKKLELAVEKPAQPNFVKAASLADIFGFNPKKKAPAVVEDDPNIPEKFRRYHKLLIELRLALTGQLDQHSEETLKRSAKDDAGDLSSYGQHMADAGTDTFDRDFALSLVSNEQEALSEIDAAIKRIKTGTYGICEVTGKPISKDRLIAVPFTRYSAEAQKDIEKNRYRSRQQAGLFGELGEEGGKISDEEASGGDE